MLTEKITISNDGTGLDKALDLTEKFAGILKLGHKDSFHLRLLAEEVLSMIRAITGEFNAKFWIQEEKHNCALHVEADSKLDYQQRKELLSVSTKGNNIAHRGIMEKVREVIEAGLYNLDIQSEYGTVTFNNYGIFEHGMTEAIYAWSMQKYKSDVQAELTDASEEWDELEKSIIANIADEVKVGVKRNSIELIIQKNFNMPQ